MYVLGIDVGTTGTKAILVDEKGRIVAKGYQGYGLVTEVGARVEQDASLWWKALVAAVRQACAGVEGSEVRALSLSTQGASSLLVDAEGEPLGMALTWLDGRATREAEELALALGADTIYRRTGWRVAASLDAAKLKWLCAHEASLVARATLFVSTLEFVNQRLVGRAVIDPTNAAIRQLMDIETKAWDAEILAATGGEARLLPEIQPSGSYLGSLLPAAASELGLHVGVGVYNGAHDQYCACLGSSITRPGEIMLSTGTAWVLMAVTEKPLYSESWISPGPHVVDGRFGALTALGSAGASLEWFRDKFLGAEYAEIASHAEREDAAKGELLFFPWLAGSAYPQRSSSARACFLGLGFEHDRWDAARAVMEGVAFQMRLALEEYEAKGCAALTLRVMGGALKSRFWTEAIRDNVPARVEVMEETDTACVGAAAFAAVGAGFFPDLREAALAMNRPRLLEGAKADRRERVSESFERWRRAGEALSALYQDEQRRL